MPTVRTMDAIAIVINNSSSVKPFSFRLFFITDFLNSKDIQFLLHIVKLYRSQNAKLNTGTDEWYGLTDQWTRVDIVDFRQKK